MKNSKFKIKNLRFLFCILHFAFCIAAAHAQSTNQNSPTPISGNEISGRIAARDAGDSRLTSYFYAFSASQGDVFINVVTSNFNGDVDVFTAGNLRPLAKITAYADTGLFETGRVVYFRQPEKLILRIEGRSPNDDPATFRIKFAGSFQPSQTIAEANEAEMPEVRRDTQSDVRVNSVGTIIEVKPKPTPAPRETQARRVTRQRERQTEIVTENKPETENKTDIEIAETKKTNEDVPRKEETIPEEIVAEVKREELKIEEVEPEEVKPEEIEPEEVKPVEIEAPERKVEENRAEIKEAEREAKAVKEPRRTTSPKPVPASAMENIRLVVLFKDGTKIERPMSEITRFGVDKGILTIVSKDSSVGRYSILDVDKVTIE